MPAVQWGVLVSIVTSVGMGFVLARGVNEPLWEGVLGVVAAVMVTTLVIQMWFQGRFVKQRLEQKISDIASKQSKSLEFFGVFA